MKSICGCEIPDAEDDAAAWGRIEFRALLRKGHYTLTQRGAWWTLWAMAGLEQAGGRLRLQPAVAAIGLRNLAFLIEQGDVHDGGETLTVHLWDVYQEPLERARRGARERQRKRRERMRDVSVTVRDEPVTLSSSSSSSCNVTPSRARAPETGANPAFEVAMHVEQLTQRPFSYSPGSRTFETLGYDVRDFGSARVMEALDKVSRHANGSPLDAAALVAGAHRLLIPLPDTKAIGEQERAEREGEAVRARDARADERRQREQAERQRMVDAPPAAAPAEWTALRDALPKGTARGDGKR